MKPTVVVIDRRCIFSECLCEFLTSSLPNFRILSVNNARQAAELAFLPVTCVLVSESADILAIQEVFPKAAFLLLSDGKESQKTDLQVPKIMLDMPRNVFAEMVRSAARHGCSHALEPALAPADQPVVLEPVENVKKPLQTAPCDARLSDRETQVLVALKRGLSNKLIAYEMDLSENTVKIHVRNVIRKLGVTNRTMAALYEMKGVSDPSATDTPH